ncbi:hypothetical protein ACFLWL_01130 [Chloroflexota bacterium]
MRKYLFLYLTLACFFSLIVIFIVDGYMGIYDSLEITAGEQPQTIEADEWLRQEKFGVRRVGVNQDEKAFFHYEVDNRQFSSYTVDIEVAVWHSQQKVLDLISQPMSVSAFDKGRLEWVVDTVELLPSGIPPEQSYEYTVIIKRGEIERKIIVYINRLAYPSEYPVKPMPAPPR